MDINKHINRQHKTTDISPYLRKAQVISPEKWWQLPYVDQETADFIINYFLKAITVTSTDT